VNCAGGAPAARPLVSAVVLNWNGGSGVLRLLEDVAAQDYPAVEIVVVDNGSTDGSAAEIEAGFPGALRVRHRRNLGFAAGMNRGIAAAHGSVLVLLNQDLRLHRAFVGRVIERFERLAPGVGMLAARVLKLDRGATTDRLLSGGILLRARIQLARDPEVVAEHATFGPSWCCPVLRRTMVDDLSAVAGQFFDETYFAYGEDLDANLRAQLRGWTCVFAPELTVWHAQSGASQGGIRLWDKPRALRVHALRNRYVTIVKDLPFAVLWRIAPALVLAELGVWPYLLWHAPDTLACLVRAQAGFLRRLPRTLHERKKIQSSRRIAPRELLRHFAGL
jgi:GT2 family glycosyltransferase